MSNVARSGVSGTVEEPTFKAGAVVLLGDGLYEQYGIRAVVRVLRPFSAAAERIRYLDEAGAAPEDGVCAETFARWLVSRGLASVESALEWNTEIDLVEGVPSAEGTH